ncbi:MAG: hypothetical protein ACHREM_23600, partial [Polyangiales bacterium]
AEASTDPQPTYTATYTGLDDAHFAWSLLQYGLGTEVGDMCEIYQGQASYTDPAIGFRVQREWSNVSAAAGHAPCLPGTGAPYFNVTPLAPESLDGSVLSPPQLGAFHGAHGYSLKVGETKSFDVGFYSDAARSPWSLSAIEGSPANGLWSNGYLDISIAGATGQNGNTATVTVTANNTDKQLKGNLLVLVSSDSTGTQAYMPIYLSAQ